jgi:hypothetical protein
MVWQFECFFRTNTVQQSIMFLMKLQYPDLSHAVNIVQLDSLITLVGESERKSSRDIDESEIQLDDH